MGRTLGRHRRPNVLLRHRDVPHRVHTGVYPPNGRICASYTGLPCLPNASLLV